ncbi:Inorganic phosphate transporter [Datura stramonium]|uniref:Inorganic phosphate transporter n=1 Tax=Datura stramonium TaxID=4076 RepID=A0ABS8SK12_DATST|nr:Inorganic phosphate transporter [Datura stramonium]
MASDNLVVLNALDTARTHGTMSLQLSLLAPGKLPHVANNWVIGASVGTLSGQLVFGRLGDKLDSGWDLELEEIILSATIMSEYANKAILAQVDYAYGSRVDARGSSSSSYLLRMKMPETGRYTVNY